MLTFSLATDSRESREERGELCIRELDPHSKASTWSIPPGAGAGQAQRDVCVCEDNWLSPSQDPVTRTLAAAWHPLSLSQSREECLAMIVLLNDGLYVTTLTSCCSQFRKTNKYTTLTSLWTEWDNWDSSWNWKTTFVTPGTCLTECLLYLELTSCWEN